MGDGVGASVGVRESVGDGEVGDPVGDGEEGSKDGAGVGGQYVVLNAAPPLSHVDPSVPMISQYI